MQFYPDLDTIKKYTECGSYDIVPVSCTLLSDFITPIEVMRKLKKASTHCYMLESAQADEKWGRYTFLGYDPKLEITCINGHMKIGEDSFDTTDPSAHIRKIMQSHRSPKISTLPTFTGGLVGYFSYDYLTYSEPTAKFDVNDTEEFKDVDLMLFDKVIVFDNVTQKIILIANMNLTNAENETVSGTDRGLLEDNYNAAISELNKIKELLISGEKQIEPKGKLLSPITPLFDKETYSDMVTRGKKHIFEGDIFQIVLSNYLTADYEGSLFETYRRLRTINPSPYMFYFSGTDVEIAGASPETLVKLEDGVLHTFPLAGTRKRGATESEDEALEKELLADEKELAEHNMLVDLGRNDLGKISKFGTVEVEKLHSIERFSHVMHIGSTVRGIIRDDKDALDAIEAVLPAGTLSGAPKIRACQLIGELEGNKRGVYGGAIGYIDFSGNMDACIAIRLLYKKNGKVFVRSGAGIVADSNPEKEYEECINKAKAALTALESTIADEEGR